MRALASIAFGAIALASSIGFAAPAAARSDVGVYISPYGFGVSVDRYRDYCRDRWYRRQHWNYCSRYYGGHYNNDDGYFYNNNNDGWGYNYGDRDDRYRDRDNHRNRHHDGDDYGYGERGDDGDRDDGGEGGGHSHHAW